MRRHFMEMDPDLARSLFEEGATLVLLEVPEGTEFGIDYNTWQVGPRFRGIKMIPPGIHFLHYSSHSIHGSGEETGPRTGIFLCLKPRDILLARWSKTEEELNFCDSEAEEEIERIRSSLQDLDRFLGPYPYDTLRKWVSLTDRVTQDTVHKLQPLNNKICSFAEVVPELAMRHTKDRLEQNLTPYDTECHSMQEGLDRLPKMKQKEGTELRFSEIPKQTYPVGASPSQITQCSMDLSYALQVLLDRYYKQDPQQILGELQFAFVCFLIGNVYDGFEHWKRLLNLMCRSEDAMQKHSTLYTSLITVLYHQLGEIPPDFFVDIVSKENFLTVTLQEFFLFATNPGVDSNLRKRATKFKAHLTKKFKWNFEADPEDCAPVIVELPEGCDGE
ncbi:protein AAR2 homolog [Polypterus senegalus]|uniref:protein AAR2 homolog n=1 Tax=Polypterus senegalus TaxID=55291 RepID=UPI0019653B53|nr:protein AAR2 homolog [Polypterus senegalus]